MIDLAGELTRRTWRWFTVRIRGLSSDSHWSHILWPTDPKTGERKRRRAAIVLTDDGDVDAFFARQAAG